MPSTNGAPKHDLTQQDTLRRKKQGDMARDINRIPPLSAQTPKSSRSLWHRGTPRLESAVPE
jgi:hypothetical protein